MIKLKVGMYVRYKDHDWLIDTIGTISYVFNDRYVIKEESSWARHIEENDDKFSHNIIDLIEVGDWVNGDKVTRINNIRDGKTVKLYFYNCYMTLNWHKDESKIKSILTKEQFEANVYRIGDE